MINVLKRDHKIVKFESVKIVNAITKSMGEVEAGIDKQLANKIANIIEQKYSISGVTPTVENIQDEAEKLLFENGRFETAKRYILYRNERAKIRDQGWVMNELQKDIYEQKYRYEGESFDEFLNRVSGGNKEAKKLMANQKFLPAGRILSGRGLNERGNKVTYSNCFVIGAPEDNLESIFDTAKKMARTYSYGGGCGTDLSKLRPNNAKVNNSAKETTGACSFADLYSTTTGLIGQKNRRGALMLTMNISHPDIIEFINLKTNLDKITKANISVMITDDFMQAVEDNKDWELKFKVEDTNEIISKLVKAKDLMKLLAKNNHNWAEPGALFWSRVENWHLNSEDPTFKYESTNPCGW